MTKDETLTTYFADWDYKSHSDAGYQTWIISAMDEYAKKQSIAFAEWISDEDCQLTPDGWVRKKENYEYYMPIQMLYSVFLSQQTKE